MRESPLNSFGYFWFRKFEGKCEKKRKKKRFKVYKLFVYVTLKLFHLFLFFDLKIK